MKNHQRLFLFSYKVFILDLFLLHHCNVCLMVKGVLEYEFFKLSEVLPVAKPSTFALTCISSLRWLAHFVRESLCGSLRTWTNVRPLRDMFPRKSSSFTFFLLSPSVFLFFLSSVFLLFLSSYFFLLPAPFLWGLSATIIWRQLERPSASWRTTFRPCMFSLMLSFHLSLRRPHRPAPPATHPLWIRQHFLVQVNECLTPTILRRNSGLK